MTRAVMPVGISDFKKVMEGNYCFIDKSLIIKDLLDQRCEVMMFTRPRRFGKTTTMSMIRYFFDQENAADNAKLFDNLAIAKQGQNYLAEQGKYPVIYLSFKDAKKKDWQGCFELLSQLLRSEYDRFSHLLHSDKLTAQEKIYMQRVIDGTAGEVDIEISLSKLTKFLHSHYGTKPILLLDEYDEPIQAGYANGYYDDVIDFMRILFSGALKDNIHLNFAIMTGILRVAKESIFSGLNNLQLNTILSPAFDSYFGFTEDEIIRLAADRKQEGKLPEIKSWYDGYKFGNQEIYNPWSVINYFSNQCTAASYWKNTSSNDIIHQLLQKATPDTERKLLDLLNGRPVTSSLQDQIVYTDIDKSQSTLFTFMAMTGYLKIIDKEILTPLLSEYTLSIPNKEIYQIYQEEILDYVEKYMPKRDLSEMLKALVNGDKETFQHNLQSLLSQMASSFDSYEAFYHGFILGLTALLLGSYDVKSNHESGDGRFCIGIFPLNANKAGVLLELKKCDKENELEAKAKEALTQIEGNSYDAAFKTRNIHTVFSYGVAFWKKKVKVVHSGAARDT